ncbi:MAG: reprolysin-like metallopeptidase [Bacteroidota bacterium]
MRTIITLLLLGAFASLAAQSPFALRGAQAVLPFESDADLYIQEYQGVTVDLAALQNLLRFAPTENSNGRSSATLTVELPTPEGELAAYELVESSIFHPDLQADHPDIRSYRVFGEAGNGRLAVSPAGVVAILYGEQGKYFITQAVQGNTTDHLAYYASDMDLNIALGGNQLSCGVTPEMEEESGTSLPNGGNGQTSAGGNHNHEHQGSARSSSGLLGMRVYRMALTCTGEYGFAKGGTIASVNATFNEIMSIMNAIYENEAGIRFQLIAENDSLIHTDPNDQPFENPNNGGLLLFEVGNGISLAGVGPNQYDIGHVLARACGTGGIAILSSACREDKARGVTCHASNNVAAVTNSIMTHEVGHQFSAPHSWNFCPGSNEQRSPGSAFEPGSGSTIMSYAGLCGSQNIIGDNNVYFHTRSLQQVITHSRETWPNCPTILSEDNNEPTVSIEEEDGFFIPISTPFILRGSGADIDDDQLTYCWEQFDLGPDDPLGDPSLNTPLFRSFPPSTSGNVRYLPRRSLVISNTTSVREFLPTYGRDMTFRLTVRDNSSIAGAAAWDMLEFEVDGDSGPFLVSEPNTGSVSWEAGQAYTVTWDVANTNQAPVNCQVVDVALSTDGGLTFPIMLAENAVNNGSVEVVIPPNITSTAARIRVLAADNIFYDMSNADFSITAPTQPGYALSLAQPFQDICLPDEAIVDFSTSSVLGFDNEVTLEVVSALPANATASFTNATITPGEGTQLAIDFGDSAFEGELEVMVRATAEGIDTTFRTFLLDVTNNDFSDLNTIFPSEGEGGIILAADFDWTDAVFADLYDIEIATSPTFEESTILERATDLTASTYTNNTFFEVSTIYFWRIRPINDCGPGPWSDTQSFQTALTSCEQFTSEQTVGMPGQGPGFTVTSPITVDRMGIISDVNIPNIDINYQAVRNLTIAVVSPDGNTRVELYDRDCTAFTSIFRSGYDDDAPNMLTCPPDDQIVFEPNEALSAFDGGELFGTWQLEVSVDQTQGTNGSLNSWVVEFCAASVPSAPELITLEVIDCPPGAGDQVNSLVLEAVDDAFGPEDLTFTVIREPRSGYIRRISNDLEYRVGDTFTQQDINDGKIGYFNTDPDATDDSWRFIVSNPDGGYIPVTQQDISIFEGATTGTSGIIEELGVEVFPNPVENQLEVRWAEGLSRDVTMELYDQAGRRLFTTFLRQGQRQSMIEMGSLPAGSYWLRIDDEALPVVKR